MFWWSISRRILTSRVRRLMKISLSAGILTIFTASCCPALAGLWGGGGARLPRMQGEGGRVGGIHSISAGVHVCVYVGMHARTCVRVFGACVQFFKC